LHLAYRGLLDSGQIEIWENDRDLGSLLCDTISLATPTKPTSILTKQSVEYRRSAMPINNESDLKTFGEEQTAQINQPKLHFRSENCVREKNNP
jgi:hypothetical protein